MLQIIFGVMSVSLMAFGMASVVCSKWAVLHSREDNDQSPPTTREIWFIRVVGVGALFGGVFSLYAILTGMQGAPPGPPLP
jgi:hypothetical protein